MNIHFLKAFFSEISHLFGIVFINLTDFFHLPTLTKDASTILKQQKSIFYLFLPAETLVFSPFAPGSRLGLACFFIL